MASSPNLSKSNMYTTQLLINGKPIFNSSLIHSIKISRSQNEPSAATIALLDGDAFVGEFELADSGTFEIGAKIEIFLGYENENYLCFTGFVSSEKIVVNDEIGSAFVVECINAQKDATVPPSPTPQLGLTFGRDIIKCELVQHQDSSSKKTIHSGHLTFQGSPLAVVGDPISVNGVGKSFSGILEIQKIEHDISGGKWITTVMV